MQLFGFRRNADTALWCLHAQHSGSTAEKKQVTSLQRGEGPLQEGPLLIDYKTTCSRKASFCLCQLQCRLDPKAQQFTQCIKKNPLKNCLYLCMFSLAMYRYSHTKFDTIAKQPGLVLLLLPYTFVNPLQKNLFTLGKHNDESDTKTANSVTYKCAVNNRCKTLHR